VNVTAKEAEAMRAAGTKVYGNLNITDAPKPPPVVIPTVLKSRGPVDYQPVPPYASYIWLGMCIILLTMGLMSLIGCGTDAIRAEDHPPFVGLGVTALVGAVFSFARIFKRRFYSWWSYLARPILMLVCIAAIVIAAATLGSSQYLGPDDRMGAL